jgi:hypothetical protein
MKELNVEQLREGLPADREVQKAVSLRAYEIYQSRGCANGCDMDDWLQAENEVLAALTEPEAPDRTAGSAQAASEIRDPTRGTEPLLSEAAPRKRKGNR